MEVIMPATRETYTRIQGQHNKYDIEYTSLRYTISLNGKVLKNTELPIYFVAGKGSEAAWLSAISDVEYLRGMHEA